MTNRSIDCKKITFSTKFSRKFCVYLFLITNSISFICLLYLQLNLRPRGRAKGRICPSGLERRMFPHRTETRLLRKLLRATSLCFRHKRPKSRGVYVPLAPLSATPSKRPLSGEHEHMFAFGKLTLDWWIGLRSLY